VGSSFTVGELKEKKGRVESDRVQTKIKKRVTFSKGGIFLKIKFGGKGVGDSDLKENLENDIIRGKRVL